MRCCKPTEWCSPGRRALCLQLGPHRRGRTHGAGCSRSGFRTAEPLGERRYENGITLTQTGSFSCYHVEMYKQIPEFPSEITLTSIYFLSSDYYLTHFLSLGECSPNLRGVFHHLIAARNFRREFCNRHIPYTGLSAIGAWNIKQYNRTEPDLFFFK